MEQLGLFAPKLRGPATCPRVVAPLCRQAAERPGGCIGLELCERLGEEEAARLRLVHPAPKQSPAVAPHVDESDAQAFEAVQPMPLAEAFEHAYWQRERMWHDAGIPGAEEISVPPGDETRCGGPETSAPTDTLVGGQGDQSTAGSAPDSALVPHGALHPCLKCGTPTLVLYTAGLRPAELAGPHCNRCADEILRRTNE